jgi:hypothetical protein
MEARSSENVVMTAIASPELPAQHIKFISHLKRVLYLTLTKLDPDPNPKPFLDAIKIKRQKLQTDRQADREAEKLHIYRYLSKTNKVHEK